MDKRCFEYKGKKYSIGTQVKIKTKYDGIKLTTFNGWYSNINAFNDSYTNYNPFTVEKYIVEIVNPVEITKSTITTKSEDYPSKGDVQSAWIWYLFIMSISSIFNARLIIWLVTTIIFMIWKSKKQ